MFTLAGGIALHVAVGHATFLAYFYLPWLLWLYVAALGSGSLRTAAGAAAVLALCIWTGGVYIAVMTAVALGILSVTAAAVRRDWRPLAILALTGLLCGLLAAPKLLPVWLFTRDPRIVDIRYFPPGPDVLSLPVLQWSLLEPFQHRRMGAAGLKYGWHEYGNYIGSIALFFAAAATARVVMTRPGRKEQWLGTSLAITTVVLLLISVGDIGRLAPYAILQALPGLGELRIPSRYLLVFTLFAAALIASVAGRESEARGWNGGSSRLVSIALVLAALFLADRNRFLLQGAFPHPPLDGSLAFLSRPPAPRVDSVTDGFAPDSPMLRALFDNRAVLKCNEPLHLRGTLREDRPIVFGEGPLSISRIEFSPNRIDFAAVARGPGGRVYMNQRFAAGWTSTAGPFEIDPATDLAYVTLPASAAGRYSFSFFPRGFVAGWILCLFGVALSILAGRRHV
jgi:hypothetical protein